MELGKLEFWVVGQAFANACHREESALGLNAYERFAKPDQ
jgi:hypothetical protein